MQSLLKNRSGAFAIRGITRNTGSDKAKALSEEGVEMVQADGLVKDQISKALEGAWGIFVNTNSDDPVRAHSKFIHQVIASDISLFRRLSGSLADPPRPIWVKSLSMLLLRLASNTLFTVVWLRRPRLPTGPSQTKVLMVS